MRGRRIGKVYLDAGVVMRPDLSAPLQAKTPVDAIEAAQTALQGTCGNDRTEGIALADPLSSPRHAGTRHLSLELRLARIFASFRKRSTARLYQDRRRTSGHLPAGRGPRVYPPGSFEPGRVGREPTPRRGP